MHSLEGTHGVMVIIIGNELGDQSSRLFVVYIVLIPMGKV